MVQLKPHLGGGRKVCGTADHVPGDSGVGQPDVVRVRVLKGLRRVYIALRGFPIAGHRHICREVRGAPFWVDVHGPLTMHFPWAAFDTRTQG